MNIPSLSTQSLKPVRGDGGVPVIQVASPTDRGSRLAWLHEAPEELRCLLRIYSHLVIRGLGLRSTDDFAAARDDLLLVDNVLSAHGRDPFRGKRQIVVGMGEPLHLSDCAPTIVPSTDV